MEYTRESIFKSALRSLCKAFFVIIGIFLAFIPVMIGLSALGHDPQELDKFTVRIMPDLQGGQQYLPLNTPAILRIDITGVIGTKGLTTEDIYAQLIESRRGLLKDDRVKGILLYISSPGGTVNDSDGIYRMLNEYKKKYKIPVYAYVDGMCASGGMLVAASCDKIIANPVSIVGSVGVLVGPFFNLVEGLEKLGVNSLMITSGKGKASLTPYKKWTEDEGKNLKAITDYMYDQFVTIVSTERPKLTRDKLINTYGAGVFDPKLALEYGYIDEANGSYTSSLEELLAAAKIDKTKPYQIVRLAQKKDWYSYLTEGKAEILSGKITHKIQLGPQDLSALKDPFAYLYLSGARE